MTVIYNGYPVVDNAYFWNRPSAWLAIAGLQPTDEKIYGLIAVYPQDANYIAVQMTGAYTVDWGDGVVENFASGVTGQHQYTYSALSSATDTGVYRQALVTITPQVGNNLTVVRFDVNHSSVAAGSGTGWLELNVSAPNATSLRIGSTASVIHGVLESVNFANCTALTDLTSAFARLYALQRLIFPTALNALTAIDGFCSNCISLRGVKLPTTLPELLTAGTAFNNTGLIEIQVPSMPKATTLSSFLASNSFLSKVTFLAGFPAVTACASLFSSSRILKYVNIPSMPLCTSASTLFPSSLMIEKIDFDPAFAPTTISSLGGTNPSLREIGALNLSNATTGFSVANSANLQRSRAYGGRFTQNYSGCKLDRAALVEIFNNLGTASGAQTITITGNPGAAALSAGERAIATGKGWTITG